MTENHKKIEFGWQFLRFYSLTRVVIAFVLLIYPFVIDSKADFFNLQLYNSLAISYLIIAALLLFISLSEQRFYLMSVLQPSIDITFLGALALFGTANSSGFAILMALVAIFALLLLRHRMALLFGIAAASLLFLISWIKNDGFDNKEFIDLALQAFAILAVSLLGNILARRMTNYESEAVESSYLISDMHQLNSKIIEKMKRGFIVIADEGTTLYINKIAWYQLGNPTSPVGRDLRSYAPELTMQLENSNSGEFEGSLFNATQGSPRLLPKFTTLADDNKTLITLEDYSDISKRIQQAKLASLGQLTASIAHEIRNPLSAINQASQMFDEIETASVQEKDLLNIIQRQSKRINNIIENVQMVSKRKTPVSQELILNRFLNSFIHEFKQGLSYKPEFFINEIDDSLKVKFDQGQLKQVLSNLFENGLKYSFINNKSYRINITAGKDPRSHRSFLDVIDEGVGISVDEIDKIFEPFYTTNHDGTGLGLYISRELCEANGAQLDCVPVAFGGACFRISFNPDYYENTNS